MTLSVTPDALKWFQLEWGFDEGDMARVFVHYGGDGGFSIGVSKEATADNIAVSETLSGTTFFMIQDDVWYLNNKDLVIDYNPEEDDIVYEIK